MVIKNVCFCKNEKCRDSVTERRGEREKERESEGSKKGKGEKEVMAFLRKVSQIQIHDSGAHLFQEIT